MGRMYNLIVYLARSHRVPPRVRPLPYGRHKEPLHQVPRLEAEDTCNSLNKSGFALSLSSTKAIKYLYASMMIPAVVTVDRHLNKDVAFNSENTVQSSASE